MSADSAPLARPADDLPSTRLRLSDRPGAGQLDGGWWPRSHDITVELRLLLAALPAAAGRVSRVSLPMSDWALPHPTRSAHRGLPVRVGWFRVMESHTVRLGNSSPADRSLLLLVVPADADEERAEHDMSAASTVTDLRATALLAQVSVVAPPQPPEPAPPREGSRHPLSRSHQTAMRRTGRTA